MVLPASKARAIAAGRARADVLPRVSSKRPVVSGEEVAVKVLEARPALCHITIDSVRASEISTVDIRLARACGFPTLEGFLENWRLEYGDIVSVWIIIFHVVAGDRPKLLHRNSARGSRVSGAGYTDRSYEALEGEPEAIRTEELASTWSRAAEERQRAAQRSDPEYVKRIASKTASRVREQLITRGRRGENIEPLVEEINKLLGC